MADGAGGYGGRCVHGADRRTGRRALTRRSGGRCVHEANGRTGGQALTRRSGRRADGAERARIVEQT